MEYCSLNPEMPVCIHSCYDCNVSSHNFFKLKSVIATVSGHNSCLLLKADIIHVMIA